MARRAKAWKFKRLLSQNEEPFGTENLCKQRFLGDVLSHKSRNSVDSIVSKFEFW